MSGIIKKAKDRAKKNTEIGLVGILTILSQFVVSNKSDKNMQVEFEKLRGEFLEIRLERERLFAKKEDVRMINTKLDQMHERFRAEFITLNSQVADIKGYLKKTTNYFSFNQLNKANCYESTSLTTPKSKNNKAQVWCKEDRVPGVAFRF